MDAKTVTLVAVGGIPAIGPGDDLASAILGALERAKLALAAGDIVVVAQKIVSKSEARLLALDGVEPSARARELADLTGKDPRLVEAILRESGDVLRAREGLIVVEHRLGHVMANAGIDRSNIETAEADVLLLPEDPDASARALRDALQAATGVRPGVIVSDSVGRAWRLGTVGLAIGVAGPPAVIDRRGDPDLYGRALKVTEVGFADAVAAAAVLTMGEGDEGCPVVLARGLHWSDSGDPAAALLRPREQDLFR